MVKVGLWQPPGGFFVEVKSPENKSKPLHRSRSWFSSHPLNGYDVSMDRQKSVVDQLHHGLEHCRNLELLVGPLGGEGCQEVGAVSVDPEHGGS